MNRVIKYLVLVLMIFAFVTMPLTIPLFKSSAPYSMFNTGWNGVSGFVKLAYIQGKEVVPIFESFDIANVSGLTGVLLIIGPNITFTREEIEQIDLFLKKGNTLLIADDFGTGNEILRELRAPVGISKYPLKDFFYETDDRFIVSIRIEDPLLARNVSRIVTNEPSAIIVTRKGEAYASKVSMVNFHRRLYPLMTEIEYGRGRIIVISDPDILTNQLYTENSQFMKNLIEYLGSDKLYVDEAHHPDFNLYTAGTVTITRVLPKERAVKLLLTLGILALLKEMGVFGIVGKAIGKIFSRFFRRDIEIEKLALEMARKKGWDEEEITEMLKRMGG